MSLAPERVRKLGLAWYQLHTMAQRGVSGSLELDSMGSTRRLQIVAGAVRVPPDHPLAIHFGAGAEKAVGVVAARLASSLHDRPAQSARFSPETSLAASPAAGSVPIGKLLRAAALLAETTPDWLDLLLPDPEKQLRSSDRKASEELVGGWEPEELWLLERLQHPMTVRQLMEGAPVAVGRLRAVIAGLLLADHVGSAGAPTFERSRDDIQRLVRKLGERIAASLEESPLELPAPEYRERITELLAAAGALDHYELLGVRPGAENDEVAHAFEALARLAHESNAARYGLSDRASAVSFLFERACQAYRTLSDPELRLAYNRSQQIELTPEPVADADRQREARQLARANFERALHEESIGDYHTALQLVEQIVRRVPTTEYWAALARMQSRNPAWLGRAIESYRAALELDPQNGDIRFALGGLIEKTGDLDRARALYQSAAAGIPPHAGAKAALERLAGAGQATGLLGKLLRRP